MEYKEFYIRAFERESGKWQARVRRTNGMPLLRGKRLAEYITDADAKTAADALKMAMATVDAGSFLPRSKRKTRERFWRIMADQAKNRSSKT